MKSIRKQQPVVVFLFLLTSTAGQGGERSLAFLHSGCSLSSPRQGPGPGVGSPLHGRAACVGSAMALFVVASSSFMCPEICSYILVYIMSIWIFALSSLQNPTDTQNIQEFPVWVFSALRKCVKHNGRICRSRARSIHVFLWSFSGRVGKLSWIHVNRQTKANILTFC